MTKDKKRFLIVDSNALLHRAFHALPPLKTEEGEQTGGVYGFLLTLFRAIKDLNPDFLVACFDAPGSTFRHKKYKEYKAQRPKTAEELVNQIPKTKKILESFKIPVFEKKGLEADDLIGTISKKVSEKNPKLETYIISGDLDVLQLIDKKTKVYTLGRGIKETVIYDKHKVVERYGIPPKKLIDFKALVGDPSDNIPGVPGIGKKTASNLLQKIGSVEEIYKKINKIKISPKVKKTLKENKEKALLSKELVEIEKNAPIKFNIDKCKFGKFDQKKVAEIFKKFSFHTLLKRLPSIFSSESQSSSSDKKLTQKNLF